MTLTTQKGDFHDFPPIVVNVIETSSETSPLSSRASSGGGSVKTTRPRKPPEGPKSAPTERAVEQVMSACSFGSAEIRHALTVAVGLAVDNGREAPTVALDMIAAWKAQASQSSLLRIRYGPKNFFESGVWSNRDLWNWDRERIEQLRNASVGSRH